MIIALELRQLMSLVLTVAVVFFVAGVACSGSARRVLKKSVRQQIVSR
jgi:hypothetical protein